MKEGRKDRGSIKGRYERRLKGRMKGRMVQGVERQG